MRMFLAAGAAVVIVTFAYFAAEGRLPGTEVRHGPSIVDKIYRAPIGALRNVRLSGEFRTGDVEGVLQALRSNFRIESRAEGERRAVLMARSGQLPL